MLDARRDEGGKTLPHEPETVEALRGRVRAALELVSAEAAPWFQRRHVFDFEDGWRLIVTRYTLDLFKGEVGPTVLHVSGAVDGSAADDTDLRFGKLLHARHGAREFMRWIESRARTKAAQLGLEGFDEVQFSRQGPVVHMYHHGAGDEWLASLEV